MTKTCLRCNAYFDGDVCDICYDPTANYVEEIEVYKNYKIKKYSSETGYRVDFGAKRSKLVITVEEARELVDFHLSPTKWDENESEDKPIEERLSEGKEWVDLIKDVPGIK